MRKEKKNFKVRKILSDVNNENDKKRILDQ